MTDKKPTVYLAGPEVFLPRARAATVFAEKKRLCAERGLVCLSPLDDLVCPGPHDRRSVAQAIAAKNELLIESCDFVVANLTPFRGPSADAGTVYEVGFARGLGKPVFCYTNDERTFAGRTRDFFRLPKDAERDLDEMEIEDFDTPDNLMIGCDVVVRGCHREKRYEKLSGFEKCLDKISRSLDVTPSAASD